MRFTEEQKQIMLHALRKYGVDSQDDIAIEEMSELTKAIIKNRRYRNFETLENMYEELADVFIMMEQVLMSLDKDRVQNYIDQKLKRLNERLGNNMKWVKEEGYNCVYRCSNCGVTIAVGTEEELPCYCKNCESEVDE
jgi:NTP pyrophosphatase (non-canonical NTP hydrolase)